MKIVRILILAGGVIGLASVAIVFYRSQIDDDPTSWCQNGPALIKENNSGWVASSRETVCSGFGGRSSLSVYVRPRGESESSNSLAFKYFEHGGDETAQMQWVSEDKLLIHIHRVSQIKKKLNKVGSVNIEYQIDSEDYPASP